MSKIAFVILHYCVVEETIECVESIQQRIDVDDYDIIIVDNCSPDGSGEILKEKYNNQKSITVLSNSENLGFAKGCNVGYSYAKKEKESEFIVLLNNDTLLLQDDFYNTTCEEYKISNFAVLGPDIKTPDGINVNPVRNAISNKKELAIFVLKTRMNLILNYFRVETFLKEMKKRFCSKNNNALDIAIINQRALNVQLHGCCLVFSPVYINKFEGLDDRTFLYMEEEILFNNVRKLGLTTVYNPKLKIYHKEDAATNSIMQKTYLKRRFIYKNVLKSAKILNDVFSK